MTTYAIETNNLTKSFSGDVNAVNDLNFTVESGTVCGLIGPNGAGKTTLIRLLLGLLRPDRGDSLIYGDHFQDAPPDKRMRVGYVPQRLQLREWMTPKEWGSCLTHYYRDWDKDYARSLGKTFDIDWNRPIGAHSGGQKRKIAILQALAHRPDLLLLDEPAAGLDPAARRTFLDLLVDLLSSNTDCTIVYSTHMITDLERLVEQVAFMEEGQIQLHKPVDELKKEFQKVQVIADENQLPGEEQLPGAVKTETSGSVMTMLVRLDDDSNLEELGNRSDIRVETFSLGLEDLFIEFFKEETS